MERCWFTSVFRGVRQRCIREVGHDGGHAYGEMDAALVECDSCGRPVLEAGRFRHRECAPPAGRIPGSALEAIARLKRKAGVG